MHGLTLKLATLIGASLLLLQAMADEIDYSNYNAQGKISFAGTSLDIDNNVTNPRDLDYPMHIIFKVDDEGSVRVQEASFSYIQNHYEFENAGGIEVDLEVLGGYYRELHKEIGKQVSLRIADITVSKAYQLDDGITFILAGHAKLHNKWSLNMSDNTKSRLDPESDEQKSRRDGKAYNQDTVNMDIATAGIIRFNYGKALAEVSASYSVNGQQNFEVYGSNEKIALDEREAKLELSYQPKANRGSKYTLGIKQTEFDRNIDGSNDTIKDTQVYFRYEYKFGTNTMNKSYDPNKYDSEDHIPGHDVVDEYIEEHNALPEIY